MNHYTTEPVRRVEWSWLEAPDPAVRDVAYLELEESLEMADGLLEAGHLSATAIEIYVLRAGIPQELYAHANACRRCRRRLRRARRSRATRLFRFLTGRR